MRYQLSRFSGRLVAAVIAATALAPASAAAAAPASGGSACATEPPRQVFADWGDPAWYWLAPEGDFEGGGGGWSLEHGAAVSRATTPFVLAQEPSTRSLSLPRGASAVSPPICVASDERVVRWVQRGPRQGRLRVEVLYLNPSSPRPGRTLVKGRGSGAWEPSRKVTIPLRGARLDSAGTTQVALRFTAARGRWWIDDLYVDPMMRR